MGLLAVGLVSGTPVRHFVQVLPAVLALVLVIRRTSWACYAALPVFGLWLFIMVAIWLYVLGLARIITGRFSPAEIALTLVIGGSCVCGLCQAFRSQAAGSRVTRATWIVVFAALQIGALWLSMRPAFATI